jgi:arylsulfatase B
MIAVIFALSAAVASKPPHVLFIVLDDLGFDDVGFRSGEIRTPHIDGFAKSGLVLDQYYVQDVCSPSRSTFMTGRYAMHHGVVDWIPPASAYGLPLNETTMAQLFQRAGYATHMSGKWHLGFYKWAMTPTFRGFDSFVGFYSGGEDYFQHTSSGAYDFRRDDSPNCGANCSRIAWQDQGAYSTTIFAEEAVRVVTAHEPSKQPLFLYLAFQGVHAPAQVPQSYADAYASTITDHKRRTFAGMLSAVDEGIGNVTAALQAKGMLDDTLIVFTTDNGGPTTTGDGVGARNWPLRGATLAAHSPHSPLAALSMLAILATLTAFATLTALATLATLTTQRSPHSRHSPLPIPDSPL